MYNVAEIFATPKHPDFWLAVKAVGQLRPKELKDFILYRNLGRLSWQEIAAQTGHTPEECLKLHEIAVKTVERNMEKISKEATAK